MKNPLKTMPQAEKMVHQEKMVHHEKMTHQQKLEHIEYKHVIGGFTVLSEST
jgi:hypothetical protein